MYELIMRNRKFIPITSEHIYLSIYISIYLYINLSICEIYTALYSDPDPYPANSTIQILEFGTQCKKSLAPIWHLVHCFPWIDWVSHLAYDIYELAWATISAH